MDIHQDLDPTGAWSQAYDTLCHSTEFPTLEDGAVCSEMEHKPEGMQSTALKPSKSIQNKQSPSKLFKGLEILTFTVALLSLIYALAFQDCYNDYVCFRNFMVICFVCSVFFCILVLIHKKWFRLFVDAIQNRELCWKLKLQVLIISSFLIIGFTDFLLLSISAACDFGDTNCDEPLLDPYADNGLVRHITRTLTSVCAILFAFTVLAYWDHFSYISAHYSWVHAILYCTIIGGVVLEISRCLVRPKKRQDKPVTLSWSWHTRHPSSEILDWIMLIVLVLVTMFVWLSAIIVPVFTEIANASHEWGTSWATLIYCFIALILGITPLAPGSVADAVGGFLLVKIYMRGSEEYNFFEAITIAFAYVTVLHFVGSCLQYWIGKMQLVQAWANFALPPDILAASDSVLLKANCIMVGIVGQVFMDTFSGLNQGRMGMDFCTQFWSEYASLPTAYSWVATGAVLSVQGEEGYEWASEAIPICLLMAATWQFWGTTFGGYKLLKANKDEMFWKNKEKWETVQYFFKLGVKATKKGWNNDCFFLAKIGEEIEECLFDKIQPIHEEYLNIILCPEESVRSCKIAQKRYNNSRSTVRNEHWQKLKHMYFEDELDEDGRLQVRKRCKDWFVTYEPVDDITNQNTWRQKKFLQLCSYQFCLVVLAILLGGYSYLVIGKDIDTEVAVQDGIKVLTAIGPLSWCVFAAYNIIVLIYYQNWFIGTIKSWYNYVLIVLFCKCCRAYDNQKIETTFKPTWDRIEQGKGRVVML